MDEDPSSQGAMELVDDGTDEATCKSPVLERGEDAKGEEFDAGESWGLVEGGGDEGDGGMGVVEARGDETSARGQDKELGEKCV